jgi:hypothetical protein
LDIYIELYLLILITVVVAYIGPILKKAVVLRAISKLHGEIVHYVVDEVIEEEGILDEVLGDYFNLALLLWRV